MQWNYLTEGLGDQVTVLTRLGKEKIEGTLEGFGDKALEPNPKLYPEF